MKRYSALCLVLFISSFAAVAQAADVKTDYDHQADFTQYHTYSWGTVKTSNPLYASRVKAEINKDLQAKGWQLMPSGGAATLVATGNVKNEQELETTYDNMGGGFGEANTTTTNQPVGHLVVDVFDSSNHKLYSGALRMTTCRTKLTKTPKG